MDLTNIHLVFTSIVPSFIGAYVRFPETFINKFIFSALISFCVTIFSTIELHKPILDIKIYFVIGTLPVFQFLVLHFGAILFLAVLFVLLVQRSEDDAINTSKPIEFMRKCGIIVVLSFGIIVTGNALLIHNYL